MELEKLEAGRRRSYRKKRPAEKHSEPVFVMQDVTEEPVRVEMTNWYHGMFTKLKTVNLCEDQLWGDLSREQHLKLKNLLNGEF